MTKLLAATLSISLFIFSGCTQQTSNENINTNSTQNKNYNTYIIGDKYNYVKKITYFNDIDGNKIIFYIDNLNSYKKDFNLCEKKESSCNSFISLSKHDDFKFPYFISFNFVFLNKSTYAIYNTNYNDGLNVVNDSKNKGLIIE